MSPRHCQHCDRIFLPATENEILPVQCPHCSAIALLGACRPAHVAASTGQDYHKVYEHEEKAAAGEARHAAASRKLYIALGITALLLGGIYAIVTLRRDPAPEIARTESLTKKELAHQEELAGCAALIRQVLEAPDWKSALPLIMDHERLLPVMTWYYGQVGVSWLPLRIESITDHIPSETAGGATLQSRLHLKDGTTRVAVLRMESGKWKFDWEAWANPGSLQWSRLLKSMPGTSAELRLLAALKPAADKQIVAAGGTPDTHAAVYLWNTRREDTAIAILPRTSVLWKRLEGISYNQAVKIIASVALLHQDPLEPVVSLDRIRQQGWLWGHETTSAAEAAAVKAAPGR